MKPIHGDTEIKLNELIEKLVDVEKGFIKAAIHVDNPKLKRYFNEKVIARNGYISELRQLLLAQGLDLEDDDDGSISGTLQRVWIDTKALFSLDSDESILEEVREGEQETINDYDEILNNYELNSDLRAMLLKQRDAIAESRNTIDSLENIE
ncbi:PA2169 family four-helix-bundle protein [Formosa sp. 3Alg 14/1]|uniref:PA2169 family four-helix-bundle protein n=1 Tax=Formosa sp. 3Alg 14/1 TaxID=3382190 RepID=UPI0039BDD70F